MDTQQEISQLKKQVRELLEWKKERTEQQLSFPLERRSIDIIASKFLKVTDSINFVRTNGREVPTFIIGESNNRVYTFQALPNLFQYSVNITTDVFTSTIALPNDTQVELFSTQVVPAGVTSGTTYYTVSVSGNTFKLSATSGGAAINITSVGTGDHYFYFV